MIRPLRVLSASVGAAILTFSLAGAATAVVEPPRPATSSAIASAAAPLTTPSTGRASHQRLGGSDGVGAVSQVTGSIYRDPSDAEVRSYVAANGLKPYMGWSSWSQQSSSFPGLNPHGSYSYLTESNVLTQAKALVSSGLAASGYDYVNIDAGWWRSADWTPQYDLHGRPLTDTARFPSGMAATIAQIHKLGLKAGLYMPAGIEKTAVDGGLYPIAGAPGCTTRDIIYSDKRTTNGWDSAYKIDFSNPCAQPWVDSVAQMLAGWGMDFFKLDGVGPGSGKGGANYDNTSDVRAWATALAGTHRPIQFVVSWSLSPLQTSTWRDYSNGARVDTDVECYCNTLATWNNSVVNRWADVIPFIGAAGPGYWNNLDALDIGVGAMDGLTDPERQSYATFWALQAAPLFSGDDLTRLDSYGTSLLTNREVIALDQAGRPARPVSQTTLQQTWYTSDLDGSVTVGLFNLDSAAQRVGVDFSDIGLSGPAAARDLWAGRELGSFSSGFSAEIPAHGSRLLTFTPRRSAPLAPTGLHATGSSATGFTVAWQPTARAAKGTKYSVRVDGRVVATVGTTTSTLTGMRPATAHRIQVRVAGLPESSAWSSVLPLTTPAEGGPVLYEAEAADNRLLGNASVGSCSTCSGGAKVGNLGGSGSLIFAAIKVPVTGTYLMKISYLNGDSARQAVLLANGGSPVYANLPGSNDNNWSTPQITTVPIALNAGSNWVQVGNSFGNSADIDAVWI